MAKVEFYFSNGGSHSIVKFEDYVFITFESQSTNEQF